MYKTNRKSNAHGGGTTRGSAASNGPITELFELMTTAIVNQGTFKSAKTRTVQKISSFVDLQVTVMSIIVVVIVVINK